MKQKLLGVGGGKKEYKKEKKDIKLQCAGRSKWKILPLENFLKEKYKKTAVDHKRPKFTRWWESHK